jgi:CheY-like chemotaxis protein
MTELFGRTLGEQVEISLVRQPDLWPALIDPHQLESALLNLAVNARDAMAEGGKLTIETANAHLDDDYASRHAEVAAGDYVMLAVSDTGAGMPSEVIARAFEPFFTTKEAGKGTGLGLSMVYGFVKQSGGHIKIYSELGHGTTIKLYLPRAAGATARAERPAEASGPRGGSETVLVVEDDADVRAFVTGVLRRLGYAVIEAADGPSAVRAAEAAGTIDLVLSDVVLPGGMNGREVAAAVLRRWPRAAVLYASGYTQNAITHQGRLDPGVELISKPFTAPALGRRVRDLLDRRGA